MPGPIPQETWIKFELERRSNGGNISRAAREVGISRSAGVKAVKGEDFPRYRTAIAAMKTLYPVGATTDDDLSPEARRALTDFAYFRLRYFGHISSPWADHTANLVADLLATPEKEFVVVNQPPGVGKSTFWTIDLPAWLIVRNRAVRIQLGSASASTSKDYSQQLRRELERDYPAEADDAAKRKGLAVDAHATLLDDFGGFKPPRGETWTEPEFVVRQVGDRAKQNKEATVRALGRDTKFLGKRCDLIVWDDLVDERAVKTAEGREDLANWWQQHAETRLEPGGLCVLQGQRLHSDDLYQFATNIEISDYDDDGWGEPTGTRRQYVHVRYKAHYDELCRGDHKPATAKPYDPVNPQDGGCLLDPRRLTFRDCMQNKEKNPRLYAVSYQQEDIDPASVLVNPLWIQGGRDTETGEEFLGCWDRNRSMGELPANLSRPWLSVVSADPSPTKFWSVQWWLFHLPTERRYLINHARMTLEAGDFLNYIIATQSYTGLLEEWWQHGKEIGAPFTHVVFEQNAAQRFLLQTNFIRNWQSTRRVTVIPHDTYANKTSREYGIQTLLPPVWRYGQVSLPTADSVSRGRSMALVNEVTRYPEASTTDCVMAQWFAELNYPALRRNIDRPAQPPRFQHRQMTVADIARAAPRAV